MSENEENVKMTSCEHCEASFSKDFIAQIKENKGPLFCEYCGVKINKRDYVAKRSNSKASNIQNVLEEPMRKDGAPPTKEEKVLAKEAISPTKEEVEEQIKFFVFRRAYELLMDPHYVLDLKKDQKDLDSYQLKVMAGLLRSRLIHVPFEEEWLRELSPIRRHVFEYYNKNFTDQLKIKKVFRENYEEFFQDAIQLIFGLIKGYPPKAGLQETRLNVLLDLKKAFGFSIRENDVNSFEFLLTFFLAAKLCYSKTFREKVLKFYDDSGEINQAISRFVLENARTLEKREFLLEWINRLKWTSKIKFKIKLNNLISEMKSGHIFCESFLDYMEWLVRMVLELIRGKYEVSQLEEVKLRVLDFLLGTNPFVKDRELQYPFLKNFMIVLSRIVRRRTQKNQVQITKSQAKDTARSLLEDVSTRKIQEYYFRNLNGISQEVFEENYAKVQFKITHDRIYRGNFFKFLYSLFLVVSKLTHENCDPKKLSESERVILQDLSQHLKPLETSEIDDLSPNSTEKRPESLESCLLSPKIEQNNDSSISIDQPQISSNSNSSEVLDGSEIVKKDEFFEEDREVKVKTSQAKSRQSSHFPDLEDIIIFSKQSEKFYVTAMLDTSVIHAENLINYNLAERLGLEMNFEEPESIQIAGTELKGYPCEKSIMFKEMTFNTRFLAIEKLTDVLLYPVLLIKSILTKYSETTGQDMEITLDIKDQSENKIHQLRQINEVINKNRITDYSKKLNIFLDSKKKDIIEGRFVPTQLNIVAEKNEFKNYKNLNETLGIWIKKNTKFKNLTELKNYFSKIELMSEQEKQKPEELIKVGERKSEQFKNIFTEENQESQAFMTNNQTKKEQEKLVLTVSKFLDEELEFLKEEHISIQDSDSKWSWLTNELAEKYFISILLPYYIIKPNLTYEDLNQLSFHTFIYRLQRTQGIRFSYIKNKYLILNKQELIKILNKNFGTDKTSKKLENAKRRLESLSDAISAPSILRNRNKLKLLFDLGIYPIKCKECDIGVNLLVALELHHFEELKEIELGDIYFKSEKEYNFLLEKFKNEPIELLCRNHHLERQLFFPIIFKEIIFKKDLFSILAEEIDIYIDNFLSTFSKTKNCKEILYRKYISNNLDIPSDINSQWKYQIKKWIKKRFVFNELFSGKCVVCGDSNLLHLGLHHLDPNLKDMIKFWKSISHLDCDEIMRKIIEKKCVCLCGNCHALITNKYHISSREVLKGYLPLQELERLTEEITLKYNIAMENISNFNYNQEKINFKCPLKLEFSQNDIWKIHLMMICYYLEIKKRTFFFRNEILYDLKLPRGFVVQPIKKLIDLGYIYKSDSMFFIRYSLKEKGKEISLILIQQHKKKANEINDLIRKYLNNKGKYEFLDYTYSKKDNCFQRKKLYSKEEIFFKYCIIIYNYIMNKGINEFVTNEIIPLFNNKNNIESDLHFILIPLNLIEEANDSTLCQKLLNKNEKVYRLTEKGINFAKSIEEI